ncbi:MAG: 4Fe-4S binding protein [Candidatus Eisenbacteria bacterium]|nr:4Fe-4S binding protein [Candidatus Eisenbacteria bacterium]
MAQGDSSRHLHGDAAAESLKSAGTAAAAGGEKGEAKGEEPMKPPTLLNSLLIPKYLTSFAIIALGIVLLFLKAINRWIRIGVLALVFVLFGLDYVFPLHPSPVCGVTKLFMFKFTTGRFLAGFLVIFLAIFIPSIVGRKLFCGWVCPLGALQELVNKIPFKPRWKQFNFAIFNAIRFALLIMFVLTFFRVKSQIAGLGHEVGGDISQGIWRAYSAYSVYEPVNFFELLHWNIDTLWWIMMAALVILSLMLYRPFCYAICPVGALSWLLEKIAPGKISVNRSKCEKCDDCISKSPCPTIKPLRDGVSAFRLPDCTSCGECLKACTHGSIKFGFTR